MITLDDEELIWNIYKNTPSYKVKYFGNFFRCMRIDILTRSKLFSKSWINSSSKADLPPDFHNNKHKIMMEFMRVDDSSKKCKNNSFKRQNSILKKCFGKNDRNDLTFFCLPNTNNNIDFNYKGYIQNFERVVNKHAQKADNYKKNYPNCKSLVFFICDESNNYMEVANKEDLCEKEIYKNFKFHYSYLDKKILEIVKNCNADFVIWLGLYKKIYLNNKEVKCPRVVIYDLKNINFEGINYNSDLMLKITKEII